MTVSAANRPATTQPEYRHTPGRVQTWYATAARRDVYDAAVIAALPAIRKVQRKHGVTDAELLADWLNVQQVPAPSGKTWTKSAVLRALRRLHELGLHAGPGPARKAQRKPVSLLWPEGRRAVATRKMFGRRPS